MLDKIIRQKKMEIKASKKKVSLSELKKKLSMPAKGYSLVARLRKKSGHPHFICEMKQASPSGGILRKVYKPEMILKDFERGKAAGISILTDRKFFKGDLNIIKSIRQKTKTPILRKDFIIDPYQIYESKLAGSDVILLITAILRDRELTQFYKLARKLKLEVLVEVHTLNELERVLKLLKPEMIGINNRNLDTLKTDPAYALQMIKRIPKNILKIVESGMKNPKNVSLYKASAPDGFLIGSALMKSKKILKTISQFKAAYHHG